MSNCFGGGTVHCGDCGRDSGCTYGDPCRDPDGTWWGNGDWPDTGPICPQCEAKRAAAKWAQRVAEELRRVEQHRAASKAAAKRARAARKAQRKARKNR